MTDGVEGATGNSSHRISGLCLIGLGCLLLLCVVGWPMYQAHSGAGEITIFSKYVGVGVLLILTGLNSVLFGVEVLGWLPNFESNLSDIKLGVWLRMAANIGVAMGAAVLFERYLSSIGYHTAF